jgi:hypothetical protein
VINVSGCLLVGFLVAAIVDRRSAPEWLRAGLVVGFCGGYTTFSTFGQETLDLIEARERRGRRALRGPGSVAIGRTRGPQPAHDLHDSSDRRTWLVDSRDAGPGRRVGRARACPGLEARAVAALTELHAAPGTRVSPSSRSVIRFEPTTPRACSGSRARWESISSSSGPRRRSSSGWPMRFAASASSSSGRARRRRGSRARRASRRTSWCLRECRPLHASRSPDHRAW